VKKEKRASSRWARVWTWGRRRRVSFRVEGWWWEWQRERARFGWKWGRVRRPKRFEEQ